MINFSALFGGEPTPPAVRDHRGPVERASDTIDLALSQHEERAEHYRSIIERNTRLLNETLTVIEALSNARVTLLDSAIDPAFERALTIEMEATQ